MKMATYPMNPARNYGGELHSFVHEQRKIISNFHSQPWSMAVKKMALR